MTSKFLRFVLQLVSLNSTVWILCVFLQYVCKNLIWLDIKWNVVFLTVVTVITMGRELKPHPKLASQCSCSECEEVSIGAETANASVSLSER